MLKFYKTVKYTVNHYEIILFNVQIEGEEEISNIMGNKKIELSAPLRVTNRSLLALPTDKHKHSYSSFGTKILVK